MILSFVFFIIAFILFCIECHANKKRKLMEKVRQQVHQPMTNTNFIEAATISTASVGVSLFEIYATMDKHSELLETLEQRFPKAHGGKDIWDWYEHISENITGNSEAIESYVSCFKGQVAENYAVELLKEKGLNAHLFDSLTNETNDIFVTLKDGSKELYSVKCGDTKYIRHCIENTYAENYIINSESYAELEDAGLIDFYKNHGITIIDGNYSDNQLTYMAESSFEEIAEAGDVSDTIPYLALACLGIKTYKNIKKYADGTQSKTETMTNMGFDIAKTGTAGTFAYLGSEAGAYVGSMICPGVGTIIGAGIGALAGIVMGNSLFDKGKEKIKWGKIIYAQEYFGEKFKRDKANLFCYRAVDKYLKTYELNNEIKREKMLCDTYKDELNPYKLMKPSVSAILTKEYYDSLKQTEKRISYVKNVIKNKMIEVCTSNAVNIAENKKDKYITRLLGELVIGNPDCIVFNGPEEISLINGYNEQKLKSPNYPAQFIDSPNIVMEKIVKQVFNSYQPTYDRRKGGKLIFFLIVLFCILGIANGLKYLVNYIGNWNIL